MHIVHVTPYFTPANAFGGVVTAVAGLAQATAARGHQVTVLTTDALTFADRFSGPAEEIIDGVRVLRVRNWFYPLRRYNLSTPFRLHSTLTALLPTADIVHLHEFRTVENLLAVPAARKAGCPLVLSPHGTLAQSTGRSHLKIWWDRLLSPRIATQIGHVVALAQAEADDVRTLWQQFGTQPDIHIIPNGVDPQQFARLPDRQIFRDRYHLGDGPLVLFMGRLHRRKGVLELVQAFRSAAIPGAKLVLAGPDEGMLPALERLQNDDIILTGYISGAERLAALAAADLFALPATGEGLSMAVLEAMAAGLPVLLSPGCNFPEAAAHGAGEIVAAEPDALAQALRSLLADQGKLRHMGEQARHLIHERFTWEQVGVQMETVYRGMLR